MEKDQRDLLLAFNEQQVRFLLVRGYALGRYTEPRVTKDLDVFVDISDENAQRVFLALAKFGAPLQGYTPRDFQDPYSAINSVCHQARLTLYSRSAQFRLRRPGETVFRERQAMVFQSVISRSIT